jgi:hypothetical protein
MRHSSRPCEFIPINKRNIPEFTRGIEDGSTEFSFSRFLTPYLAGYKGIALFMDCDMLVRCDIHELLDYMSLTDDVAVVKHDYKSKVKTKFLGNVQHEYPMKNWSSLILFNCYRQPVKNLTPEVVNNASGKYLHRFEWCTNIGEIPKEYNHLVGEYDPNPNAKIVHFTLGTPCFQGYADQEFAREWRNELRLATHAD